MRIEEILAEFKKIQEMLISGHFPDEIGFFSELYEQNKQFSHYLIIFYSKNKYSMKNTINSQEFREILRNNGKSNTFFKPSDPNFSALMNYMFSNIQEFITPIKDILKDLEIKQSELDLKLWKHKNQFYYFQNPFEPSIIFHLLNQKDSFIAFIQIKELFQQQKESLQTSNTMLLKDQLFALLEEKNSLQSHNSEKQMEIEMLKSQLELSFNSYEDQIVELNEKIRELERENRILREKISENSESNND